jgi:PIN domain nuclease of toxin-antitoxin system
MNLLLDTVALYRAATMPDTLPEAARDYLRDSASQLRVSLASAWELAIKSALGKLALPCAFEDFFAQSVRDLLATTLDVDLGAIARVTQLPPHHRDPFDRLIIAQALIGGFTVVTSDRRFEDYGVKVIW